jgi:hypothetical protein
LEAQGASPEELTTFLRGQGYLLHRFDARTGLPTPAKPMEYSENMIAAPEEASLPASVYSYWPVQRQVD